MSSHNESNHGGFTCYWIIENFELCKSTKYLILHSQTFEVNLWNNFRFHLEIQHTEEGFLGVYLLKENHGSDIYLHFSVSLLRKNENILQSNFTKHKFVSGGEGSGTCDLIKWDELFKNVVSWPSNVRNTSLTISFHMWKNNTKQSSQCFLISRMKDNENILHLSKNYFHSLKQNTWIELMNFLNQETLMAIANKNDTIPKKTENIQPDSKEPIRVFNDDNDLLRFFAEKKFCYVTLRTTNKDFAVHKALICARSPVFRAMFDTEMKESERNIVDIDDIDHETLSLLLQFLHLQPLGELKWETAVKLYYAADKYQIEQLKNECRKNLKNKLTTENVCELFLLSHMHKDEVLRCCAQNYFNDNFASILQSKEWDDLFFNQMELAREILRMYAKNPYNLDALLFK